MKSKWNFDLELSHMGRETRCHIAWLVWTVALAEGQCVQEQAAGIAASWIGSVLTIAEVTPPFTQFYSLVLEIDLGSSA